MSMIRLTQAMSTLRGYRDRKADVTRDLTCLEQQTMLQIILDPMDGMLSTDARIDIAILRKLD